MHPWGWKKTCLVMPNCEQFERYITNKMTWNELWSAGCWKVCKFPSRGPERFFAKVVSAIIEKPYCELDFVSLSLLLTLAWCMICAKDPALLRLVFVECSKTKTWYQATDRWPKPIFGLDKFDPMKYLQRFSGLMLFAFRGAQPKNTNWHF